MTPILNLSYRDQVVQRMPVENLSSGLQKALIQIGLDPNADEEYFNLLEPLTVESMRELRLLLSGLSVSGHYFDQADERILNLS